MRKLRITCPNKACRRRIIPRTIEKSDPPRTFCAFCGAKIGPDNQLISVPTGPRSLEDLLFMMSEEAEEHRRHPAQEPIDYRP
jgi:hypothetical protein